MLDSLLAPEATADPQGGFTRMLKAPDLARSRDREEMSIGAFTDQVDQGKSVFVQWTLSAWGVAIPQWAKHKADPLKSMAVDAFGWTASGSSLYAHYYRGTTHIKSVKIGALTGPCGNLRRNVKQFPFRNVKPGAYRVFFSATAVLDKVNDDWHRYEVTVPRAVT